ncbi:MAG: DUF2207 domain-containing protein [Oscillospiraceae bacterium]
MKKRISIFLCLFTVIIMSFSIQVFAKNNVSNIDIDVALNNDGSAVITQKWSGDFKEGTECYIPMQNLGSIEIKDFSVSGKSGKYQNIGKWNVDASFSEKANKCGINKIDGGYELCFGISEYGQNSYTFQYTLTKLLSSYDSSDGFNFQFVNSGMGTLPTNAVVKIRKADNAPLNDDNTNIWAFGFDGDILFANDGTINAKTKKPLSSSSESVIIMIETNKGVFTPSNSKSGSFEKVKERAFEGSDYGNREKSGNNIIPILLVSLVILGFGATAFTYIRKRLAIKKMYKDAGYCRDIPIGGNIEAVYKMALDFHQNEEEDSIITASFLKMIMDGNLEPLTEIKTTFLGNEKESISLKIISEPINPTPTIRNLFHLLSKASGSDGILQEKELAKYCEINYEATTEITENAKVSGEITLGDLGCYNGKTGVRGLTEKGKELLNEVMGFKKYLLDFSLIGERGVKEVVIWQDYLVFASVLGIADKALEELKKLYPENFDAMMPYPYDTMLTYIYISNRYNNVSYRAAAQAAQVARTAGSGGSASFGGGGGFSGGGMGGGTR